MLGPYKETTIEFLSAEFSPSDAGGMFLLDIVSRMLSQPDWDS